MGKANRTLESLDTIHPNAAGLDIGAREIWACVPADRDAERVRPFGTFTPDLGRLVDWLVKCGVDSVAMESTGIYWLPVFEMLEARGLSVYLVNARHIKHVPGRKSDYLDCQWIQKLHALGLLTASFRPDAERCRLRAYLRHRAQLIEHRSPHILHIQKALHQMNIQLTQVLKDITGGTGQAILRAIVAGERDAVKLAQLRNPACKSSQETLAKALSGDWKPEQLFVLKQSLEVYDFYTAQVTACDTEIQHQFSVMKPRFTDDGSLAAVPMPQPKRKKRRKNSPAFDVQTQAIRLTGVDLAAVDGLSDSLVQTILSEIGTDMSKWPTEKHFASWLGLAPHNDISGGRVLRSRTLPTDNRAGKAFRQAATTMARSRSAFGAYYRRKRAKGGPQFAQVATAHKIARTVYYLLKHRVQYQDIGADFYEQKQRERELDSLRKKATKLGFTLTLPGVQQAIA
jgi:transposase